jgi:hypothetical protein
MLCHKAAILLNISRRKSQTSFPFYYSLDLALNVNVKILLILQIKNELGERSFNNITNLSRAIQAIVF